MPKKIQNQHQKARTLLALAEFKLFQAQVVGTDGLVKNIFIYASGPDMFFSKTREGLFSERRQRAPEWLRKQIRELPPEVHFRWDGSTYAEEPKSEVASRMEGVQVFGDIHVQEELEDDLEDVPSAVSDSDVPGSVQA